VPTRHRVIYSKAAEADVDEIWTHIAADNPDNATRFIQRLEEHIQTLARFPQRCPSIPENATWGASYRHLIEGDYRVIFRIARKTVYIVRVVHGARMKL
jgi:plasmid stabilization system protein ParE